MLRLTTVVHNFLKETVQPDWFVVDGTAGNGVDCEVLCSLAYHVDAFDIQEIAKDNTLKRCQQYNNLTFHCCSHHKISDLINHQLHLAIFNFGYLPRGDKTIITTPSTSVIAVQGAYNLLVDNGYLLLTMYRGHDGGQEEHDAIVQCIQQFNATITTYDSTVDYGPILYIVQKKAICEKSPSNQP